MPYSLTISRKIYFLQPQKVMGILNLTPDSFFTESRCTGTTESAVADEALRRVERMLADGMDILDLGAVSTRPGSQAPTAEEEWRRLRDPLRRIATRFPDLPISIDTFRADVARYGVENGAHIINGKVPHALLLEMLTDSGMGTMVTGLASSQCLNLSPVGKFAAKLIENR